jgi:hypothetical protein
MFKSAYIKDKYIVIIGDNSNIDAMSNLRMSSQAYCSGIANSRDLLEPAMSCRARY